MLIFWLFHWDLFKFKYQCSTIDYTSLPVSSSLNCTNGQSKILLLFSHTISEHIYSTFKKNVWHIVILKNWPKIDFGVILSNLKYWSNLKYFNGKEKCQLCQVINLMSLVQDNTQNCGLMMMLYWSLSMWINRY